MVTDGGYQDRQRAHRLRPPLNLFHAPSPCEYLASLRGSSLRGPASEVAKCVCIEVDSGGSSPLNDSF
jgi:hypothetical protein